MSGNRVLLDTNIIIYLLSGDKTLAELLQGKTVYVSFIFELELLGFSSMTQRESEKISHFLGQCYIVDINPEIKTQSVTLRKKHKIKLPDSILMATALFLDVPLISADKGLSRVEGINFILYER
ncbi:MAG: type II toxin-antitoxin system VapC family toxin [Cyclobacteriaceae bacterium]